MNIVYMHFDLERHWYEAFGLKFTTLGNYSQGVKSHLMKLQLETRCLSMGIVIRMSENLLDNRYLRQSANNKKGSIRETHEAI